jgi:hypothetical protein
MDRIIWKDSTKSISFDTNSLFGREGVSLVPLFGKSGYMLPPVRLITDNVPRRPGNVLRERKVEARRIDLPFRLETLNYKDLVDAQRELASSLFNSSGDLVFNFAGKQRYLKDVSYVDGFLGDDNDDNEFVVWAKFMLTFEAHDPYFYSLDEEENITISASVDPTASPVLLDTNFLDSMLGENLVGDSWEITNPGADTAWVKWEITGPVASGFTVGLENGPSLKINRAIEDGEVVTIDTSRGQKIVRSSLVGDIFNYLDKTSNLWGFPRGTSKVELGFSGFNAETTVKGVANVPYSTF